MTRIVTGSGVKRQTPDRRGNCDRGEELMGAAEGLAAPTTQRAAMRGTKVAADIGWSRNLVVNHFTTVA